MLLHNAGEHALFTVIILSKYKHSSAVVIICIL